MVLLQHAVVFFTLSQLLFMGLFYLLFYRAQLLGKLVVLYTLCVAAYVLSRLPEFATWPPAVIYVGSTLASLSTSVLWVTTHHLFVDRPINPIMWIVIAALIATRAIGNLLVLKGIEISALENLLYFQAPRAFTCLLAIHVIYMAIQGLKTDLVKPRRQLRVPFAITMGTIIILIVGSNFFNLRLDWLNILFVSILFVLALLFNLAALRTHKKSPQLLALCVDTAGDEDSGDKALVDRLHMAMEKERLYAQHLTVGMLASRFSMPEHKLRRLINQKLHYRNFNQYLNSYRIKEAARRLQNPAESHLPISTISLDVGYASQSTFNKSFKELKGVTPSQFRGGEGALG